MIRPFRCRFLILAMCLVAPWSAALAQPPNVRQEKTAADWTTELTDKDIRARWYAAYALGQLGPAGGEAVSPLGKILENREEHEYVRAMAAWALGRMGTAAEPAVPLLMETLDSRLPSIRRNAAEALGQLGSSAKPAVDRLSKALGDEDPEVRVHAAVALWRIEKNPKAFPVLEELLGKGNAATAHLAAVGLGQIGGENAEAAASLVRALDHADADVRRAASRSLGRIGAKALPVIRITLAKGTEEARRMAVEALGEMGPEATGELTAALGNDKPAARREAARALGRLGTKAKAGEAALLEAVSDRDEGVRQAAAEALRKVRGE
jgi:HEAT repeat protein